MFIEKQLETSSLLTNESTVNSSDDNSDNQTYDEEIIEIDLEVIT